MNDRHGKVVGVSNATIFAKTKFSSSFIQLSHRNFPSTNWLPFSDDLRSYFVVWAKYISYLNRSRASRNILEWRIFSTYFHKCLLLIAKKKQLRIYDEFFHGSERNLFIESHFRSRSDIYRNHIEISFLRLIFSGIF